MHSTSWELSNDTKIVFVFNWTLEIKNLQNYHHGPRVCVYMCFVDARDRRPNTANRLAETQSTWAHMRSNGSQCVYFELGFKNLPFVWQYMCAEFPHTFTDGSMRFLSWRPSLVRVLAKSRRGREFAKKTLAANLFDRCHSQSWYQYSIPS